MAFNELHFWASNPLYYTFVTLFVVFYVACCSRICFHMEREWKTYVRNRSHLWKHAASFFSLFHHLSIYAFAFKGMAVWWNSFSVHDTGMYPCKGFKMLWFVSINENVAWAKQCGHRTHYYNRIVILNDVFHFFLELYFSLFTFRCW